MSSVVEEFGIDPNTKIHLAGGGGFYVLPRETADPPMWIAVSPEADLVVSITPADEQPIAGPKLLTVRVRYRGEQFAFTAPWTTLSLLRIVFEHAIAGQTWDDLALDEQEEGDT